MGIYSLVLLFLGILIIGLVYAKTGNSRIPHHILFAIILLLFLVTFFIIHHHFGKTCAILIAGNLDQVIKLIRSWGVAAPLMSILLMITQAIVSPIPAFLVTAANGSERKSDFMGDSKMINYAQVVTDRKGACGGCQSSPGGCRSCLTGAKMESRVANPVSAEPGDLVKVHLSSTNLFTSRIRYRIRCRNTFGSQPKHSPTNHSYHYRNRDT